jgi:hypothetical protein
MLGANLSIEVKFQNLSSETKRSAKEDVNLMSNK